MATTCDRCGQPAKHYSALMLPSTLLRFLFEPMELNFELCPPCVRGLKAYLKGRRETIRIEVQP